MSEGFQSKANKALQDTLSRNEPRIIAAYGLIGAILLFGGIGYVLDRWWKTAPWLLLAGLLAGVVIGFLDLIRRVRRT